MRLLHIGLVSLILVIAIPLLTFMAYVKLYTDHRSFFITEYGIFVVLVWVSIATPWVLIVLDRKIQRCETHVECIKESINDFRHVEDIGLIFISLGITVMGITSLGLLAIYSCSILVVVGIYLVIWGGKRKNEMEKRLCTLQ